MPIKNTHRSGVGILELMIALSIGAIVATMVITASIQSLQHLRLIGRYRAVQSDAVYIADTFAYWVKQAELLSAGGNTVELRVYIDHDNDDITPTVLGKKVFVFDSGAKTLSLKTYDVAGLLLDDSVLNSNTVKIGSASFTLFARSVRASFTLDAIEGDETMSITTTVAQRNHP